MLSGWPVIFLVNVPGLMLSQAWLLVDAAPLKVPSGVRPARTGALAVSGRLVAIYAQFAAVNFVLNSVFFGLPLWLEDVRGYSPDTTGLLSLPVAGVGVLATPVAARLISRVGPQPAIATGSLLLVTGSLLLFPFDSSTSVPVLLVIGAVLDIPNGSTYLGLQAALYQAAPAQQMGCAGGLFQTSSATASMAKDRRAVGDSERYYSG